MSPVSVQASASFHLLGAGPQSRLISEISCLQIPKTEKTLIGQSIVKAYLESTNYGVSRSGREGVNYCIADARRN